MRMFRKGPVVTGWCTIKENKGLNRGLRARRGVSFRLPGTGHHYEWPGERNSRTEEAGGGVMEGARLTKELSHMTKNVSRSPREYGHPAEALFSSPSMVALLEVFFLHPEEEFYQRQLEGLTGKPLLSIQRELRRLERAGLVESERRGNRLYYRARGKDPAFRDLRAFFLRTIALGHKVARTLQPYGEKIRFAFIYGSYASGEDRRESDLDLLIVGDVGLREISGALSDLSRDLGREINPLLLTMSELRGKSRKKDAFLARVAEGPRIWILGDEDEFKGLLG